MHHTTRYTQTILPGAGESPLICITVQHLVTVATRYFVPRGSSLHKEVSTPTLFSPFIVHIFDFDVRLSHTLPLNQLPESTCTGTTNTFETSFNIMCETLVG